MDEFIMTTTVDGLSDRCKPGPFSSYWCTPDVREQLGALSGGTKIDCYGSCSFRLADDHPSYTISRIIKQENRSF